MNNNGTSYYGRGGQTFCCSSAGVIRAGCAVRGLSVCLSVARGQPSSSSCLHYKASMHVGHSRELCKNGRLDRHAVRLLHALSTPAFSAPPFGVVGRVGPHDTTPEGLPLIS